MTNPQNEAAVIQERVRKIAEDTYPPIKDNLLNSYSDSAVRAIRVQEFMYGYEQARKELTEAALVKVIEEWKFGWMNVTGTNEEDAARYRRRAFGIDANMIYGLARRLQKQFGFSDERGKNG